MAVDMNWTPITLYTQNVHHTGYCRWKYSWFPLEVSLKTMLQPEYKQILVKYLYSTVLTNLCTLFTETQTTLMFITQKYQNRLN